jgi:hypothetical protein
LIQIKVHDCAALQNYSMEWESIATAPFDRELELAVIDKDGPKSKQQIDVRPTHWRKWDAKL